MVFRAGQPAGALTLSCPLNPSNPLNPSTDPRVHFPHTHTHTTQSIFLLPLNTQHPTPAPSNVNGGQVIVGGGLRTPCPFPCPFPSADEETLWCLEALIQRLF
jgi:hypothetical protein